MNVVAIILQALLGLMFLMAGVMKIARGKMHVDNFDHWKLPQWFRVVTGFVETICAVGILIGIWVHSWGAWAGILLAVTMFAAIFVHIRVKDPAKQTAMPVVLFILSLAVALIQRSEFVNFPY